MSSLLFKCTLKDMPRIMCFCHCKPLGTICYKQHQSKTLGYYANCDSHGENSPIDWLQYVLEGMSSKLVPMKQGYMEVASNELTFMVKARLEVKATTKPKKSKEPKSKPMTNQSTDYPKFYLEHIVKEIKLLEHFVYVNGKLNHDTLEVDYSKHLPIQKVNLGTEECPQMINIGAQFDI